MENNETKREITVFYIFSILRKSFIFMIIAAIVFGALAAAFAIFFVKPTYHGQITLWANDGMLEFEYKYEDLNGNENTSIKQWIKEAPYVATFCVEIINERVLAKEAVERHGLAQKLGYDNDDDCINRVMRMLSASKSDEDSTAFTVKATGTSKKEVYEVLAAVQDVMPDVVSDITGLIPGTKSQLMKPSTAIETDKDVVSSKLSAAKAFVIAGFLAAVIAYAVIFIVDMFDTRVYSEQTIKDNFTHPVIGSIPTWSTSGDVDRKRRAFRLAGGKKTVDIISRDYTDRLLSANTPFAITESFNSLRTNVIFAAAASKNPVVAMTSSISAEGKSLICANLAHSLALLNKRVLLVECDMRCPVFAKIFGAKIKNGLSELLAGIISSPSEAIKKTDSEYLDIIFCGKIPPNPSELLGSESMQKYIEKWKSEYDFIILDLPPICEVADAGVVSSFVSGYVLAVRSNYSDVNEIKNAVSKIQAVNGNVLGYVINDVNIKNRAEYSNEYRKIYRRRAAYKQDSEGV